MKPYIHVSFKWVFTMLFCSVLLTDVFAATKMCTTLENFSGGFVGSWNSSLPIELLSFNAIFNGKTTDISWQTEVETNNNYFTIERSNDGVNFNMLGIVASKALNGNSTGALSYTLSDSNKVPGIYYYRLKQTNFDFKYTYLKVVSVTVTKGADFSFDPALNPNDRSLVDILITAPNEGMATLKIYDMAGNRLHIEDVQVREGEENQFEMHLKDRLENGTYIVICVLNEDLTKKKVMTVNR